MSAFGEKLKKLFLDRSLLIFLIIGAVNTVLSQVMMQLLLDGLGYWGASALAFFVTSLTSFYFNRRYSFHSDNNVWADAARFAVNIAVCYLLAYGLARPLAGWLVPLFGIEALTQQTERISMLVGQILFTAANYFGQRFFAFKKK